MNAQIHLRDMHIETSKGGQVWVKRGGEKGKKLKGATLAVLQLKAHSKAQPGKGRNWVVAGTPFSQEEQRNLVSILIRVSSTNCGWAHLPGWDTALQWGSSCRPVSIPDKETKLWSLVAHSLSELISLCPWCLAMKHTICKLEKWYYRINFILEQRVHFVTGFRFGVQRGLPDVRMTEISITEMAKQHRRLLGSPSSAHPTPRN